jgi:hypothetical protein
MRRNWCVGITACPRTTGVVDQVIDSLRQNDWQPTIYAEPETKIDTKDARIVRRDKIYGCWTNWICALHDMYVNDVHAEGYAIFEDDILICKNLRNYLEHLMPRFERLGALSLYTPERQARMHFGQACVHDNAYRGDAVWGTQAVVFSNYSLAFFLSSRTTINHRRIGIGKGNNKNRDSAIGVWAKAENQPFYYHTPSLVQHVGEESSVEHEFHCASDFVGDSYDAMQLLPLEIPIVSSPSCSLMT